MDFLAPFDNNVPISPETLLQQYVDVLNESSKRVMEGGAYGNYAILARKQVISEMLTPIYYIHSLKTYWREWNGEFAQGKAPVFQFYRLNSKPYVYEWSVDRKAMEAYNSALSDTNKNQQNLLASINYFADWSARLSRAATDLYDQMVLDALNNATNAAFKGVDDLPFFSTTHPQDPTSANSGNVWSNYHVDTDLNEANLRARITAIKNRLSFDGRKMGLVPHTLLVPPELEWIARELLQFPTTVPSGNTSVPKPNLLYGMGLKLVVMPNLPHTNRWYLLSGNELDTPFVLLEKMGPMVVHLNNGAGDGATQAKRMLDNRDNYAMIMDVGFAYNLPHLMDCCVQS